MISLATPSWPTYAALSESLFAFFLLQSQDVLSSFPEFTIEGHASSYVAVSTIVKEKVPARYPVLKVLDLVLCSASESSKTVRQETRGLRVFVQNFFSNQTKFHPYIRQGVFDFHPSSYSNEFAEY